MSDSGVARKKIIGPGKYKCKFTPEEDKLLKTLVLENGDDQWEYIATLMRRRNARQCKDRWTRYLSPKINRSEWSPEEERLLIQLVKKLNFKWSAIAKHFVGRTDNQIKNKWNVLKKRINQTQMPLAKSLSEYEHSSEETSYVSFFNEEFMTLFEQSMFNPANVGAMC